MAPIAPGHDAVVAATLRCIARWGVGKTSLDDVAREAGVSRATVYRLFPGGKDAVLQAVAAAEVAAFFARLDSRLRDADTLEDLLVVGITEACRALNGHAALQVLLTHEPEVILSRLAFHEADEVLRTVGAFAAPHLSRFLGDDDDGQGSGRPSEEAVRAAEWVARIVLSYTTNPGSAVELEDPESVRRLVAKFVLPGLLTPASV